MVPDAARGSSRGWCPCSTISSIVSRPIPASARSCSTARPYCSRTTCASGPRAAGGVEALVAAGRLQVGPWYVLADELIPSGESLIRNLLAGTADAERLGGRLDVLYCPDAFGHPGRCCRPLGAEFGIRYGVLWRGLGGEPGQERDLYRWRGPGRPRARASSTFRPMATRSAPRCRPNGSASATCWPRRAASRHLGGDGRAPITTRPIRHSPRPSRASPAGSPTPRSASPGSTNFSRAATADATDLPPLDGELRWSLRLHLDAAGRPRHPRRAEAPPARPSELALERGGRAARGPRAARRGVDPPAPCSRPPGGCCFARSSTTRSPAARPTRWPGGSRPGIEDAGTHRRGDRAPPAADALIGNDPGSRARAPDLTAPASWCGTRPRERAAAWRSPTSPGFGATCWSARPGSRVPRLGASPRGADVAEAVGGLPFQLLGRAVADERLDSPHHYPDQDEVEVTRVAVHLPPVERAGLPS